MAGRGNLKKCYLPAQQNQSKRSSACYKPVKCGELNKDNMNLHKAAEGGGRLLQEMVEGGGESNIGGGEGQGAILLSDEGRNQKGPDFWSKIRNQFFQAMGRGEYRTNDMLSSKWRDMNLKVRKFNGIYSQKWQTRRSGQSDAMIELESEDQYWEEFNAHFTLKRS
ncbi:hypothetical protein E3N88_20009 [Mikania micrantha]|uniref:Myb/SANT-like domain-containing protein n=1 Tax=Mikania micrantha TaxID=192012 RepID=A0A5N6NFT4_9ASTR|nr:hypothetical protein E3N88_20009 [Mikania micrantha]